jgi:uncharacterized protein (TIGR03084 family)
MSTLDDIVADLSAEHAELDRMIANLADDVWERPTHAPGWAVRDQVAHLAYFDEQAALAMRDTDAFHETARELASADPDLPPYIPRGRALKPQELLAWWRDASSTLVARAKEMPQEGRLPWYGPDMSPVSFVTARLMECWSHGLDIEDVVDAQRPITDRLKHVSFICYRTRAFSYTVRNGQMPSVDVRVDLTAPSGEIWSYGPADAGDRISGPAVDFCMVCTQRRHVADTDLLVEGEAAREWMEIAQAFAGAPGQGRRPGQFPKAHR